MQAVVARCSSLLRRYTTTATAYPFSNVVALTEPVEPPTGALRKGKGLMQHLSKTLVDPEKSRMMDVYFSRRHPMRWKPGSVLTAYTNQAPFQFSGVLMGVRRRGPDTSFTLRNVVQRMGVEMQFFVNSPDLTRVEIIKMAGKGGGREGRKMRRAKLNYLRHSPDKMSAISAGIRG